MLSGDINLDYIRTQSKKKEILSYYRQDFKRTEALELLTVQKATFLPWKKPPQGGPIHGIGGILDSDDNYVDLSATDVYGKIRARFIGKYEYDKDTVEYLDTDVIYLGLYHRQWGHFLVDFVPRLWPFVNNDFSGYKIVYTTDDKEFEGNYSEFLELFGIDRNQLICIRRPTQFRSVIIPELSFVTRVYWTDEFVSIFNKVKEASAQKHSADCKYDNIYLSRRHFPLGRRKEVGEKGIERLFCNNGFRPVHMEEMNLADQIALLNNAGKIVAFSGTLCHNILFDNEKNELIILEKRSKSNWVQNLINQAVCTRITYIDIYNEPYKRFPLSVGRGPFWLTNRSRQLRAFCKDNHLRYTHDTLLRYIVDFVQYTCKCIRIGNIYRDNFFKKHINLIKTITWRIVHGNRS